MLFAGIDVGSQSTDVVIINGDKKICGYSIIPTSAVHADAIKKALELACLDAGCTTGKISHVISTGYGRKNVKIASGNVTEITCHAKGTYFLNDKTRIILDIGGQDSKVIKLDHNGNVIDFMMNEKCAAGTGRFLESMARILGVELSDMGPLSLKSTKNVKLSSVCTVFAESEVVSQIAEGNKIEDILNGIHDSVCNRAIAMIEKINLEEGLAMTGGVAKNIGIINTLSRRVGVEVFVPDEPQIIGALGAAVIAFEEYSKQQSS